MNLTIEGKDRTLKLIHFANIWNNDFTVTPSCVHARFGCWTCTVVEHDKASEGLLASGDERMNSEIMSDWKETNRLRELQEQVAAEGGIRADTLRRLLDNMDHAGQLCEKGNTLNN